MSAAARTPAITTRGREDANVPDHLRCCICLDAPPSNAQQCRNGHIFCGEEGGCLSKLRASAQGRELLCPACRTQLPEEPNNRCLSAEQTIALLPATCRHCKGKTTRGALVSHESSCSSAPDVKCAAHAEGCVWLGRESDRVAHQAECALVLQRAHFDAEREATSQATARVVDALLGTTTSAQEGKNKALLLAAEHDNLAPLAGRLIAGGVEVDAPRPGDGWTPLILACGHGNLAMVARLIEAGSQVDKAATDGGMTSLFFAAQDNRLDVVKLLIAAGAEVNKARVGGWNPLLIAAVDGHAGVVSVLLETAGVDLNAAFTDGEDAGMTPMFLAAQENRLDVVKLLIAAGVDVNTARAEGATPLHAAAHNGHAGVVSVLLETAGADMNAASTDGELSGITPLFLAAQNGHEDVVSVLIETPGVDPNAAPSDGKRAGVTPLFSAAQDNRLDVVKLLIAAGADVNKARDDDGCTPLHVAAEAGHADVVDLLIADGAKVNATCTSDGATALSLALAQGHAEVVQKLRAAGAI
jgi:ankyrin repeat protein